MSAYLNALAEEGTREDLVLALSEQYRESERLRSRYRHAESPMIETKWLHIKTGAIYEIIGECRIERDNSPSYMYVGEQKRIWVRPIDEFMDGRFSRLMTSADWLEQDCFKHVTLMDPDGWDRGGNFEYEFRERLLTKSEVEDRLMASTVLQQGE